MQEHHHYSEHNILSVHDLGVRFGELVALQNVSFDVHRGDVVAFVGPNGSGKSVLFRALLDLIPYSGDVDWVSGIRTAYVPQHFVIERDFPLSVLEFLQFKEKNEHAVIKALTSVGLGEGNHLQQHILTKRLGWLSGGQMQRVMVAWSLLDNPDVLLYDEPTSGIDVGGEETIYHLLGKLRDERHMTILLISHDLNIVYKYASEVICINRQMVCSGPPREALDPQALQQLYGGNAGFYTHEHTPHSHE
jgi:zinc transport system ATP-binding protein